jgi:membrane-bound lytic murein transglycosylase D
VTDFWVDERRDPYKSTVAAARYLKDLQDRFHGDWYLAWAGYNAGERKVDRAIQRERTTDFWRMTAGKGRTLRAETRHYVPKLIAAALIAKQPTHYGFTDIERLPPLVFDEVSVPDATGLDVLARLADTAVAALLELNPQFVRGITPPGRAAVVRVPRGRGAQVAERYADLPVNERITFVDHYVTFGQTLSSIAQRYKVTVTMLQAANPHMRSRALRVGQRVIVPMSGRVVPRGAWSNPPEPRVRVRRASPRYRMSTVSSEDGTRHRVAAGETASGIARSHGIGLMALLEANDLTMRSVIRAGDVLLIPAR